MVKWAAFFMAWFAVATGAYWKDVRDVTERVVALERQKCTLMVVNTPTGTATICATQ